MEYRAIIFNSARDGNLRRLRVFLEDRPPDIVSTLLETKTFGTPSLVIAARNGHLDVVNYLISKGSDLSATGTVTFDGETIEGAPAIWAASAAGHVEVTQALLTAGADVNQTTASNSSALRGACYDGHLAVVRLLVGYHANVEIGNRHGHTPLMIAAYREKTAIVEYLLKVGADPNAVSSKGNTALHDAAEAGHVTIAQMLLDAGARIQKDDHGLTPMLSAAMIGNKNVVDLFRPMCTAQEQVDALKLLGATNVDKRRDISSAIRVWREAVILQSKAAITSTSDEPPPKPVSKFELPVVYEQVKELDSESYLDTILGDPDSLRMQALLIRERILGDRHPETHYYLRYRGAIYADVGQFERCFQLWTHALHLQQSCLEPLNQMTQATILAFAEIFGYILNERSLTRNAEAPITLTSEHIVSVLEKAVDEIERGCGEQSPSTVDGDEGCQGRMAVVCLYLVELIGRLEPGKSLEETDMLRALRRLVRIGARACDGSSPLHAACDEQSSAAGRYPTARFPSLFVVRRLMAVGGDVWARDGKGNTPLHVVLRNKQPRLSIAKYLLAHGAPILSRSSDDVRPWDIIKLNAVMRTEMKPGRFLTLKGLASNAIRRAHLPYEGVIPRDLLQFVHTH
uniref:Uncharacterized protein n=1 Tax=Plectus sambesii TaxID=2011161 RepID=A0A914XP01_9BILA